MTLKTYYQKIFKKDKLDKKPSKRELTANAFLNVKDIKDKILYTKDNMVFCYVKLQPISLELLSEQEKVSFIKTLTSELSSEKKAFKFFMISRPVDISTIINDLSEVYAKTNNPVQKDLLKNNISVMNSFAMNGEVIERQFYAVIWEKLTDDSEKEIIKRANDLRNKFENSSIHAEIADQSTIIRLCNLYANPAYAHFEDTDIAPTIPIINRI